MITIDGSKGEGGGQMIRSSLSLAALTGESVRLQNIRAGRARPGLMRQHLTAANAVAEICGGHLSGAEIGASEISLQPGSIRAGNYSFSIGSAGSANLVLQTVLPLLLHADGPSTVKVSGGTHNSASPPFDFLEECFLPALRRMGHDVSAKINAYGFYPAGGGEIEVSVTPQTELSELVLTERGQEQWRSVEAVIANLFGDIAKRELATAGDALGIDEDDRRITTRASNGPGNVVFARVEYENLRAVFAQFGEKGTSAEQVAKRLAKSVKTFAASQAAVTHHLADQLLLPMALAKGGQFTTLRPSLHATSNADIISKFTGRQLTFEDVNGLNVCTVR